MECRRQPDLKLLLAMLDSSLDEARTQGVAWLREAAAVLQGDGDFLAGVAFLAHEDARIGVREVLRAMPLAKSLREEVVARVLSGLLALDDEAAAGRATDWLEFIAPEEVAALPDEHVAALAGHPLEACQLLAVRILLKRGSPSGLPESLLMAALSSEHASVRRPGDGAARTSCGMTNWRNGWKRWRPARCRAMPSCGTWRHLC